MLASLSLRRRLIGGFALVIALFAGLLALNLWTMSSVNGYVEGAVDDARQLDAVQAAESAALRLNRHALRAVAMSEAGLVADQRTDADAERLQVVAAVAVLREQATPEDLVRIEELERSFGEADALFSQLFDQVEAGGIAAAQADVRERCIELSAALTDAVDELVAHYDAAFQTSVAGAGDAFRAGRLRIATLAVVISVVAFGLAWWVADGVTRRVAGSVAQVTHAATELDTVSQGLHTASQETDELAGRALGVGEAVTTNVGAVAASIEQVGHRIGEVSSSAAVAADTADDAVARATAASGAVGELAVASEEIGAVLELIGSIAEQTDLLALNATIEAARAGDAGRGFAVVASEVKELARDTAEATGRIEQRIAAIRSGTAEVTDAIDQIVVTVGRIAQAQATIADAVASQTATNAEITANVDDAARGSADIAAAVGEVAEASRRTAEHAATTRSSAGSLTAVAAELQALLHGRPPTARTTWSRSTGGTDRPATPAATSSTHTSPPTLREPVGAGR